MKRALSIFIFVCIAIRAMAIPADRTPFTHVQTDGTTVVVYPHGDEFHHYFTDGHGEQLVRLPNGDYQTAAVQKTPKQLQALHRKGVQRRARQEFGRTPFLVPRGVVILVEFQDVWFKPANPPSEMDSLMNGMNYRYNNATGSVRQFFMDQSDGQYTPLFSVIGPVRLPHPHSYYGTNDAEGYDQYLADFVIDACLAADSLFDFSQMDYDNDGYVDFVYLLYAGYGEADSGGESVIWPCNWSLDVTLHEGYTNQSVYTEDHLPLLDGKYINSYACSNELRSGGARAGIGNVCHEYSHVIGLPDVYDPYYGTNYTHSATPGRWHLMDQGSYNNNGRTPPSYSPWDKYFLGWVTPTVLSSGTCDTLPADGRTYRYMTADGLYREATSPDVVYYLENRQQTGWDRYVPGHGLLVWKVRYDGDVWAANEPNASESDEHGKPEVNLSGELHYTLVSAAGNARTNNDESDPFPGSANSTVCSVLAACTITDIAETDGLITCRVDHQPATDNACLAVPLTLSGCFYDLLGRYCGTDASHLRRGIYFVLRNGVTDRLFIP